MIIFKRYWDRKNYLTSNKSEEPPELTNYKITVKKRLQLFYNEILSRYGCRS